MGMIQKHAEAAYFCAPVVAIAQIIADRRMWAAGVIWPWQTVGRQLQQHPLVRALGPSSVSYLDVSSDGYVTTTPLASYGTTTCVGGVICFQNIQCDVLLVFLEP